MRRKRRKYRFNLINLSKIGLKNKLFAFFCILIILVFLYVKYLATPIVVENTRSQINDYATKSINYAVAETMNQNVSYGDLINIVKDNNNNVSYIETNSVRINLLSRTMSKVVLKNFLKCTENPIKISLGSFTGISILSGAGPKVAYFVNPFGEVYSSFSSNFESAGINQTYHKIYLTISLKVNVVLPFKTLTMNRSSQVLLCETLIVGKIPEVYLSSNSLGDMLDLVPERFGK